MPRTFDWGTSPDYGSKLLSREGLPTISVTRSSRAAVATMVAHSSATATTTVGSPNCSSEESTKPGVDNGGPSYEVITSKTSVPGARSPGLESSSAHQCGGIGGAGGLGSTGSPRWMERLVIVGSCTCGSNPAGTSRYSTSPISTVAPMGMGVEANGCKTVARGRSSTQNPATRTAAARVNLITGGRESQYTAATYGGRGGVRRGLPAQSELESEVAFDVSFLGVSFDALSDEDAVFDAGVVLVLEADERPSVA